MFILVNLKHIWQKRKVCTLKALDHISLGKSGDSVNLFTDVKLFFYSGGAVYSPALTDFMFMVKVSTVSVTFLIVRQEIDVL